MSHQLILVLVLLAVAVVLFARNRPRMDAVAVMMMAALPLTGVIGVNEAIAGFADPNVVLIALLFVIGDGLVRTGVAQRVGDAIAHRAGASEAVLIVLLMLAVAGIGSVMSSTGVVALFIPIVLRISRNAGIAPGRLMMPLSVAALLSGMMTLVATPPNLIVHGELTRAGLPGFGFFDFAPFGIPLLVLAIGYMLLARRWLAGAGGAPGQAARRPRLADWIAEYRLAGREHRLRVPADSPMAGRSLAELDLRATAGVNILAVEQGPALQRRLMAPQAQTRISAGDVLLLDVFAERADIEALKARYGLEPLPLPPYYLADRTQSIGMAQVMVPATSTLVGRSVVDARLRSVHLVAAIGLKRGSQAWEGDLLDERLRVGDTLLVVGPWAAIRRLDAQRSELVVLELPWEYDDVAPAAARAPHALFALAVLVLLMTTGAVPNVLAALIAVLIMGAAGCINMASAYRAIHWQSLVLIVGMMPFALALQQTGGIELASQGLLAAVGELGPHAVLATLFCLTAVLGLFISNTATAVLMAPLALTLAQGLGASPYPFAMTIALAASAAFMTPVSSPVNTLVVGPGNYRFADFVKVGVPLALISLVVCVTLVPWLMPF